MKLRIILLLAFISSVAGGSAQDSIRYYIKRGITMAKIGDYPAALHSFDLALAIDSTKAEAWYNKGLVRTETGDFPGAISDLTRAIRLKPGYPEPRFCRAEAKEAQNDLDGAIQDYSKAIAA